MLSGALTCDPAFCQNPLGACAPRTRRRLQGGSGLGGKPSDNYDYGEPGKYGEPYEMIDDVEEGEDDD